MECKRLLDLIENYIELFLKKSIANLLVDHDYKKYLDIPKEYTYSQFPKSLLDQFQTIEFAHETKGLAIYHQFNCLKLMRFSMDRFEKKYSESIIKLLYENYFRIIQEFDTNDYNYYSHKNDAFLKDLGICSLRLLPVGGAWLIEETGISRKFFITGGIKQLIEALCFVIFRHLGATKPFYVIHTMEKHIDKFNEKERLLAYLRISEMLMLNHEVKGFFASSWFYDPILKHISPRLHYLIKEPIKYGAKNFKLTSNQSAIKLSLKKSPTRRRLYHSGNYLPTNYCIIWYRKNIFQFYKKNIEKFQTQI